MASGPLGRFLLRSAGIAALSLLLAVVLFHFVFQPFQVAGLSMSPSLEDRDYLLVDRVFYRLSPLRHGDIVVFRSPADDRFLVKRVAALPGEVVETSADGSVRVNGALALGPGGALSVASTFTLPQGRYFCLGDNALHSQDSRTFGPVGADAIHGRVLLRYFPPAPIPPSSAAAGTP